jgi:hypothetical protein
MAAAITYENGITTMPGWEYDGRFVHMFGVTGQLWTISSGLTFFQQASGDLEEWVKTNFAATSISKLAVPAATVVEGVWRPGLVWEEQVFQALNVNQVSRRSAEQALHGLVERLTDLLLYLEPEGAGLTAYGQRTRELLILACTEVENLWIQFLSIAGLQEPQRGFNTTHYVKLCAPLRLEEFQVSLAPYAGAPTVRPFRGWTATAPTQTLGWYDAYNKTKHNRAAHLPQATVERCLEAVAASLILFCVRYSPFSLYNPGTPLATLASHLFNVELVDADPTSFYVPLVKLPAGYGENAMGYQETKAWAEPWKVKSLKV